MTPAYPMSILRTLLGFVLVLVPMDASFPKDPDPKLNLMPVPSQVIVGEGMLLITPDFRIETRGHDSPLIGKALSRFVQEISNRTGMPLETALQSTKKQCSLRIECLSPGDETLSLSTDESYSLDVSTTEASLTAPRPAGVLHGLQTFIQLLELTGDGYGVPTVQIKDAPRFRWRGLLLDVCRHWEPMEVVKRTLDGMAAVKLNVLHWHLSDDQGFRIESKRFPRLHLMGSDGKYFTQDQAREIVAYARERSIRVVPEFDMPGHTTAWFAGHPELASAPGPYQIERSWGVFDPCMDPTRQELYDFLDGFIAEMAALFPDEYFHIGGDEVTGKQWNANPAIQSFKQQHGFKNHDLQVHFNKQLVSILSRHGKRMIGWDEILHPELPHDIVIQSWRGQTALVKAAQEGYRGILSFGYYLDHILSAASHYAVDPLGATAQGMTSEQKSRILGGEACMWAEFVTPENIDSRIWPRTAAVAERLWSPATVTDTADMYRRLEALSRNLEWLGIQHVSGPRRMLERLAGSHPAGPLAELAALLEPVKLYARPKAQHYTSFTPLNRLVDAVTPESDEGREFSISVDALLATRDHVNENSSTLRQKLLGWRALDAMLKPIIADSYLIKEARPISEDVSALAAAALEALDSLQAGERASQRWRDEKNALLQRAEKPQAELLIMIVPGVRKLVDAVSP